MQQQQQTNNLSQLKCELNSLIKNSTPHESLTNVSEEKSPTNNSASENGSQKYRQFMFFKNHLTKKKNEEAAASNLGGKQEPNKSTRRNLLRQKSTSLHSLVDEKLNANGSSRVVNGSSSGKVKSTAGNLTKNLNSKFKFYRKYSLKN